MYQVKVIIPIYRLNLSPMEQASILQTLQVLREHPILILHPENLNIPDNMFPPYVAKLAVSEDWLGTRNGIAGYNSMMMSHEFYQLFSDTEYILICHTDAWIFRDELTHWCKQNYDCIAAPWIERPIYRLPIIKQYMKWLKAHKEQNGKFCRQTLYGKVGNGGLSLRRVEAFKEACITYRKEIETYNSHREHCFNEDVFWATIPENFRYPTENTALQFSFDRHPAYCLKRNNGQLPFGCHSWNKPHMYAFWKHIINWEEVLNTKK